MPGDFSSLVASVTTGDIYGHIVSSDPSSGLAFIIPAYKIFDDIEKQFGARPSFPTPSEQRFSNSHKKGFISITKVRNESSSKAIEAKEVIFNQRSGAGDNWTEISKNLVNEDAIKHEGYQYKDTKGFYYVTGQLKHLSSSSQSPIE